MLADPPGMVARGGGRAAGSAKPRPTIVESLSETVRRHGAPESLVALIDAARRRSKAAFDVLPRGHALADLELAVLGIDHAPTRQAARAVGARG